jgi:hypothetical protein
MKRTLVNENLFMNISRKLIDEYFTIPLFRPAASSETAAHLVRFLSGEKVSSKEGWVIV